MSRPNIVSVTDAAFESEVLAASGLVLLKFEAEWCGPCRAMRPAIEEIAREYEGRLTVATMDTDENPRTPHRYGVRGIPTVLLFRDGEVVGQRVGLTRKAELAALIDRVFASYAARETNTA
jgi:thioredoxin 1